jgi:nicotinamide-nucleotide amidase
MSLKNAILDLSRQAGGKRLSPWFERQFERQIESGRFPAEKDLQKIGEELVGKLRDYRETTGIATAVLGMSGGVDSALTAALLKAAGWHVVGLTLPINQNTEETERGIDACKVLGLEHLHLDLTEQHKAMVAALGGIDEDLKGGEGQDLRTRRGNIAARLRMVTLYDQAHRLSGVVVSTDNFSEKGAGFWTLHGDVGDLAPLQSLLKSWEVPWLAREYGVPENIWRAEPTDGLGIGGGDEAQIGVSYLEWDIAVFALMEALIRRPMPSIEDLMNDLKIGADARGDEALGVVLKRLRGTWYKRVVPFEFSHPADDRLGALEALEVRMFRPAVVLAGDESLVRFTVDLKKLAVNLGEALRKRGWSLVTAESCTSGLLGAAMATVPGSTHFLDGGVLTYTPAMKTAALGVSPQVIAEKTVYSPEVAREMAEGALQRVPQADLALSVTGIGGPDSEEGKPPGLVYICAAARGGEPVVEEHLFKGHPQQVLAAAIRAALLLGTRLAGDG